MANFETAERELEALGYRQELKRSLSLTDLVVYGLIFIGPTAPFTVYGFVYNASHGMPALVYAVGLVAMTFTALSYLTMSRAFPLSGSVYAYVARGAGPFAGFLAGWAILLDYILLPTLSYVIAATVLHVLFPVLPKIPLILGFIVAITAVNLAGLEAAVWVNRLLLLAQVAVLVAFLGFGGWALAHGVGGAHLSLAPLVQLEAISPSLIFGALSLAVLSFLGFDAVSTLAEEAKGGARAVGVATLLSLTLAAALFIGQTYLASLFVLGHPRFADGDEAATAFLVVSETIGGPRFRLAVSVGGMALGALAGAGVAQAAAARILYSMGRDGQMPRFLAHVSGARKIPDRGVLLIAGITIVTGLFFSERLEQLTSLVTFGALAGFMALHVSVILHFRAGANGGSLWRHLIAPVLGAAIIGYVLVNADPMAKLGGLIWLGLGVVVASWLRWRGRSLALRDV